MKIIPLDGKRFGRLVVIDRSDEALASAGGQLGFVDAIAELS